MVIIKSNNSFSFATSKYLRVGPTKINKIISKIRGKTYKQALEILKDLPQKSASLVWQTLYSAISNGTNNFNFERNNLFISEAYVNAGSILKRMRPRARGKAFAIEKKFSHITIKVAEIKKL